VQSAAGAPRERALGPQVVVLLDGKAVTGFTFADSVFKTTSASPPAAMPAPVAPGPTAERRLGPSSALCIRA